MTPKILYSQNCQNDFRRYVTLNDEIKQLVSNKFKWLSKQMTFNFKVFVLHEIWRNDQGVVPFQRVF